MKIHRTHRLSEEESLLVFANGDRGMSTLYHQIKSNEYYKTEEAYMYLRANMNFNINSILEIQVATDVTQNWRKA